MFGKKTKKAASKAAPAPESKDAEALESMEPSLHTTDEGQAKVGETEDPRVLLSEAIGDRLFSMAKTNTTLKIGLIGTSAVALVAVLAAYTAWQKETEFRYFFMDTNGTILESTPSDQPAVSLNIVRDFYAESISHLFSFHYRNFAMHYQRVAPDIMTEKAMIEFSREMDRIGLITEMEERREVAEAVIEQTPVLSSSGVDPRTGVYTWELTVPFNLRLESGRSERQNVRQLRGVARVQIIRVDPVVHPRQILINRITIRDTGL